MAQSVVVIADSTEYVPGTILKAFHVVLNPNKPIL